MKIDKLIILLILHVTLSIPFLSAKTITVYPGGSIQNAINRAKNGDTVKVKYGKYKESLSLRGKNIKLIGVGRYKEGKGLKLPKLHGQKSNRLLYVDNRGSRKIQNDKTLIQGFKFVKGYAKDDGGAIQIRDGASITIENCEFVKNEAKSGGAISVLEGSQTIILNSLFKKNKAKKSGAAVHTHEAVTTIKDCEIYLNYLIPRKKKNGEYKKSDGAALMCSGSNGYSHIENNQIYQNHCYAWGSAILLTGGKGGKVLNNTIYENWAIKHGAVVVAHNTHVSGSATLIQGNTIRNNWCGEIAPAIYIENAINVTIDQNIIKNNFLTDISETRTTPMSAGAFYAYHSTGIVKNNSFLNNSATIIGACVFDGDSDFVFESNLIKDNTAKYDWPGVVSMYSSVDFKYNRFENNKLKQNGDEDHGASLFILGSTSDVYSNLFIKNSDMMYILNSDSNVINNAFIENSNSYQEVIGMTMYNSNVLIANNIFYKNEGLTVRNYGSSTLEILNNNFEDNGGYSQNIDDVQELNSLTYASGNLSYKVEFVEGDSYKLVTRSYLIDVGAESIPGLTGLDIEGNTRIIGLTIDIGPYEID